MQLFDLNIEPAIANNDIEIEAIKIGTGGNSRSWDVGQWVEEKAIHNASGEPHRDEKRETQEQGRYDRSQQGQRHYKDLNAGCVCSWLVEVFGWQNCKIARSQDCKTARPQDRKSARPQRLRDCEGEGR